MHIHLINYFHNARCNCLGWIHIYFICYFHNAMSINCLGFVYKNNFNKIYKMCVHSQTLRKVTFFPKYVVSHSRLPMHMRHDLLSLLLHRFIRMTLKLTTQIPKLLYTLDIQKFCSLNSVMYFLNLYI